MGWLGRTVRGAARRAVLNVIRNPYEVDPTQTAFALRTGGEPGRIEAVPAAYAAVNLLSSSLAQLEASVVMQDGPYNYEPVQEHPTTVLLKYPNPFFDPYLFWETSYRAMFARGNSYLRIERRGGIAGRLMLAASGAPRRLASGRGTRVIYQLDMADGSYTGTPVGAANTLAFHTHGFDVASMQSPSPIAYAARQPGEIYRNAQRFMGGALDSGIAAKQIIEAAPEMTPEQYQAMIAFITDGLEGLHNAGRAAVLPPGFRVANIGGFSSVDVQLIEAMKWQTEDIARVFNVPLRLLQYLRTGTRGETGTFERSLADFFRFSLQPHIRRLESQMTRKLLRLEDQRNGMSVRFDTDRFTMGTLSERASVIDMLVARAGVLTINEGREIAGMAPHPEGDRFVNPKGAAAPEDGGTDDGSDGSEGSDDTGDGDDGGEGSGEGEGAEEDGDE